MTAALSLVSIACAQGSFVYTDTFKDGRENSGSTTLKDGRVLFVGGTNGGFARNTAEIYDPATGTFTLTGQMIARRGWPSVAALSDGRAIVFGGTGGADPTSSYLYTIEIWDPATGTFSQAGQLPGIHVGGPAFQLPNGHILLTTGGYELWIYDMANRTVKTVALAQRGGTPLRLPSGRFCIIGETNNYDAPTPVVQLFDPTTETIVWTGSLNTARSRFAATVLKDGRVFISGGLKQPNPYVLDQNSMFNSCEIFDPATGAITTYNMINRRYDHWVAQIPDGRVMIVGPEDWGAEIFDPTLGTFTPTVSPQTNRSGASAITLPDTRILLAGGRRQNSFISHCELFVPTGWGTTPPPTANAGPQQIVYTGTATQASVTLNGSGSTGTIDTYTWTGTFGTTTGASPTITLPIGISTITLTVVDQFNRSASANVLIAVVPGLSDTTTLSELQYQLSQANLQIANLTNQLSAAQGNITTLQTQNASLTAANASLQVSLDAANAQIQALNAQINQLSADKAQLLQQNSDLAAANATLTAENTQLKTVNADLAQQLATANATITSLGDQVTSLTTKNAALQSALDTANAQVTQLTADKTQLAAANANLTNENQQLTTANATLTAKNQQLTAANADLTSQVSTANAANAALQAQIASLSATNASLTATNTALQSELNGANAQIQTLTTANAALTSANQQLTNQNQQLAAANAALTATINSLNQQNATLTAELQGISQLLATAFNNPGFQIPGATIGQQLQNLATAIGNLNHGQQQALYSNLNGK